MSFKKWVAPIAIVAGGIALAIWWDKPPPSYEDCMLDEMRGQHVSMRSMAHLKCAKRSRKEFSMDTGNRVTWTFNDPVLVISVRDTGEMKATRGVFRLSTKECADSADADFSIERDLKADADGDFLDAMFTSSIGADSSRPRCMKTLNLYGIYTDRKSETAGKVKWFN